MPCRGRSLLAVKFAAFLQHFFRLQTAGCLPRSVPVNLQFSLGHHKELFCTRRHPSGCPSRTTANLSPSVESVAGVTTTRGVLLLQRFPLACSDTCIRKYAEGLDTVIDFRLRFGLFWWRIQYSQRARGSAKTQAH